MILDAWDQFQLTVGIHHYGVIPNEPTHSNYLYKRCRFIGLMIREMELKDLSFLL